MVVMRNLTVFFLALLFVILPGCGKVKEASQLVKSVKDSVDTVQTISESVDSEDIDLDKLDISEKEVRDFYSNVKKLNSAYPEINFEVALTAALEASTQGKNLERIIEKESDMSFKEYSTLSMAFTMVLTESMGVSLAEEMVSAMEDGLAQFDDMDTSAFTEEQLAEIESQRQALIEAKKEMDTPEFKARKNRVDMVSRIREELMD